VDAFRVDADITEEVLPWVLRGASTTDPPPADALAAVAHPTLIVARETDPVHVVTTARYLRSTMPDATLHVSGTVDDVRTWANRIDEFLS
jgi:pimeloyl-ACP methyl ester carboxylesterase